MIRFKLVLFALRTNVAFYALLAIVALALHFLVAAQFVLEGFLLWALVLLFFSLLFELSFRGLRERKTWAWFLAVVASLVNLGAGGFLLLSFIRSANTAFLSRQLGAISLIFYLFLSGAIILLGLFFEKPEKGSDAV